MTPEEYLKIQEANKKIYELAKTQEEKINFLARMMDAEIQFIKEKALQVSATANMDVVDSAVGFTAKSEVSEASKLDNESKICELTCSKITPQNFFDKVKIEPSKNPDGMDIHKILKENPEILQQICDLTNEALKKSVKEMLNNQSDLAITEDDQQFKFKRSADLINDPDAEASDILTRAQNFIPTATSDVALEGPIQKNQEDVDEDYDVNLKV